jgi:hypothetical protein
VHAHMRSAKAGQHPTDAEPITPVLVGLVPHHGGASSWGQRRYARCAPTLSLACSCAGPTHMLSCVGVVATRVDSGAATGARHEACEQVQQQHVWT